MTKAFNKGSTLIFLGYNDTQKGYLCYDASRRQLRVSKHFDDDVVAIVPPKQPMNYDHDDLHSSSPSGIDSTSCFSSSEEKSSHLVTSPRRSSRTYPP
ncbi:hypothetical protein KY290_008189 [Solanum tuberosum]|uniref:Retroviral polymerase SH3-like domain-containing protein n=1 Tax=Solanum tuberosum TaxID=4113 RepID=A0ABQ7W7S0_SOLTU|nr:hypothetical protein KY290_008189 [Solanum tuberosum]